MEILKIIGIAASILAGSIGLWFDFTKSKNRLWGVLLMSIIVGGVFLASQSDKTESTPSQPLEVTNHGPDKSSNDSLYLLEVKEELRKYERMLQAELRKINNASNMEAVISDNLQKSNQLASQYSSVLADVKQVLSQDSAILADAKNLSVEQGKWINRSIDKIDSALISAEVMSSNLIFLENQLELPIDHIDLHLRISHRVDEKTYKYYKLRNHFAADAYASKKGSLRVDHISPNSERALSDFIHLRHAFLQVMDSTNNKVLIKEDHGFGNITIDEIYLYSNTEGDSLMARVDYLMRVTPKRNLKLDLFVESLKSGNGKLKIFMDDEVRTRSNYSFNSIYWRIHSGNHELGLMVDSFDHNVEGELSKTDVLDFKLGNKVFNHRIVLAD